MDTTRDWQKPVRRLELLMRLKSFLPVAFKLFEDKKALSEIPFVRTKSRADAKKYEAANPRLPVGNYEVMQFYCVGETSCSDAITRCP